MLKMCMQKGQRRSVHCLESHTGGDVDSLDNTLWRYDWHGCVVWADMDKNVIGTGRHGNRQQVFVSETFNQQAREKLNQMVETGIHSRQMKRYHKNRKLQRKQERRMKTQRMQEAESDAFGDY